MNPQIINANLINQVKHKELYEPSLLDFLLQHSDLAHLKEQSYDIYASSGVYLKSNFEGFLFANFHQKESPMKEQIYGHFGANLEAPQYFGDIEQKSHNNILSQRVFLLFNQGIDSYLKSVHLGQAEPLDEKEEKFFLTYLLTKDSHSFFRDESKKELYKILCHQKAYLQFKNSKSQTNIFLQNSNLKTILDLFTNEEVEVITGERPSCESLVKTYFKKLHRSKVFDLHKKLQGREPMEIYESMISVFGKENGLSWFAPLVKQGTNTSLDYFETLYKNHNFDAVGGPQKLVDIYRLNGLDRKPQAIKEMLNIIELIKDVSPMAQNPHDIAKIFLIVIATNREDQYLKLRTMFELPEHCHCFLDLKVGKKTIQELEIEILNNNLQKELPTNQIPINKPKL